MESVAVVAGKATDAIADGTVILSAAIGGLMTVAIAAQMAGGTRTNAKCGGSTVKSTTPEKIKRTDAEKSVYHHSEPYMKQLSG